MFRIFDSLMFLAVRSLVTRIAEMWRKKMTQKTRKAL